MICVASFLVVLSACSREDHLQRTDRDAYGILAEKVTAKPWHAVDAFDISPDSRSRFYDQYESACPTLPVPAPQLYAYNLPELAKVDRFGHADQPGNRPRDESAIDNVDSGQGLLLRVRPIEADVWDSLPAECLQRMLEFQSIVDEYQRSFQRPPLDSQLDTSERLTLSDIIELALINSRDYQTQKEDLYRVALRLSLQRYDYELNFSRFGNSTGVDYTHSRTAGVTVNGLGVPTSVGIQKITRSGADLVARFANDVVLTFNGPTGFAVSAGSDLLLQVSQSVLQRDVIFEQLTQAERNVIYAARDYARFRRIFFRDFAIRYYSLLLDYRGIEIDTQTFFTNLRAFDQGQAEYRAGRLPRIQVDQFEQRALERRSNLIRSCNTMERSLDELKFRIGIPPETAINLDLRELEVLTLRDKATVARQLVSRSKDESARELASPNPQISTLLNTGIKMAHRLSDLDEIERAIGNSSIDRKMLDLSLAQLQVDESRLLVRYTRQVLDEARTADPPITAVQLFRRTMETVDAALDSIKKQLAHMALADENKSLETYRNDLIRFRRAYEIIATETDEAVQNRELDKIPVFTDQFALLLVDVEQMDQQLQNSMQERSRDHVLASIRTVSEFAKRALEAGAVGLQPIVISHDDALLTALTLRWDLANQREQLADTWRQIKLTSDDLRSILNWNVSQQVRTRSDVNRVFDFTFDDSTTRIGLSFDTPLNRFSQGNNLRNALINYHRALRGLMEFEDRIKLDVRDDLRQLSLDRTQYDIAVASAALSYERVISTRLQLQLNIEDVAARDFLEAEQDYTSALSAVAAQHIGYLNDRIQLFLGLEQLEVDETCFWPELYREDHAPVVNQHLEYHSSSPYGDLPDVWYSDEMLQMLCVPAGESQIHSVVEMLEDLPPPVIIEPPMEELPEANVGSSERF
jgi:outer membrane protein TolC